MWIMAEWSVLSWVAMAAMVRCHSRGHDLQSCTQTSHGRMAVHTVHAAVHAAVHFDSSQD
jgi:hypothetical protein